MQGKRQNITDLNLFILFLALPYAFSEGFPSDEEAQVTTHMGTIMADLGCMETIKVPRSELLTTPYNNGIMFVWQVGGGCFYGLGVSNSNFGVAGGHQGRDHMNLS